MIWVPLIILGFSTFVRFQLRKYLGLDLDWHLFFHFLTLALGIFATGKAFAQTRWTYLKFEKPFLIICMLLLLSGLFYPSNDALPTWWGVWEYLYIFLWAYFLSFFAISNRVLRLIWRSFKVLVFLMVGIALYQELEYLLYTYHLISGMLFHNHPPDAIRLGILRPPSLVGGPTEWASVAMIYLLADLHQNNFRFSRWNRLIIISILLCMTRSTYVCLLGIVGLVSLFDQRGLILPSLIHHDLPKLKTKLIRLRVATLVGGMATIGILLAIFLIPEDTPVDFLKGEGHLRGYAFMVARRVENPVLGLGPGMFGSYVSAMTHSPYLTQFANYILLDFNRIGSIDSFWLQIYIEMGVVGLLLNLALFYAFYRMMLRNFQEYDPKNRIIKSLAFACIPIPLIYALNGIGFTTFVGTYTFWGSLLSGAVLSYLRKQRNATPNDHLTN